ncbi:unnamed protein product [Prorocentrum cordatum]|uniref:Ion transport domain-containing protein n=1 Tax=Prorocentrum cordatum TaxID=2364126 RepID=A0ABN9XT03_9DINO|nr:unnamed protein product [Polarella glacialis]
MLAKRSFSSASGISSASRSRAGTDRDRSSRPTSVHESEADASGLRSTGEAWQDGELAKAPSWHADPPAPVVHHPPSIGDDEYGCFPRDWKLSNPLTAEEKRDSEESFHELLKRLSNAHDKELRVTVDQLVVEKAELQWQVDALRTQLAKQRFGPMDKDQGEGAARGRGLGTTPRERRATLVTPGGRGATQSSPRSRRATITVTDTKGTTRTSLVVGTSRGSTPELASLEGLPSMPSVPDTDEVVHRSSDDADVHRESANEDEMAENDEECFPARPEYTVNLADIIYKSKPMTLDRLTRMPTRQMTKQLSTLTKMSHPFYIASPRSPMRTAWEVLGAILICWDLLMIPLTIFCYPMNGLHFAMEWITLVYWTLHVPQTLTVGYEDGLKTVTKASSVLVKYLKSWFIIDAVVLVPDWVIVVLSLGSKETRTTSCDSAVEGSGAVKLLRNLRLMRLMRLTRIARLQKAWQLVKERIHSLELMVAANILTMLLLLLVLSHFISCLWYAISYLMDGDKRWLVHYGMDGLAWNYLYATCLHWSLTQFTPAPMDIQPQNFPERVFTISVVVCALVGFSYVVGAITASLAQLRSLKEEESKLFWDLRVYLKRNHVEHLLSIRVQRYLQHVWRYRAANKTYQQIKILAMLSEQLENELLFQLHSNHLTIHPLVDRLLKVSKVTAFRLAKTAVSTKQVARLDPIFIHGEKPSHMYVVIEGQFQYKRVTSEGDVIREMVDKGEDWIAEPVLWTTEWYHLGDCTATDQSNLMLVSPHHFCKEAQRNPTAWVLVTNYSKNFLKWLNSTDLDDLSDVTQGDETDVQKQLAKFMVVDDIAKYSTRVHAKAPKSRPSATTMIHMAVGKIASR